jgi:hypothetical protein
MSQDEWDERVNFHSAGVFLIWPGRYSTIVVEENIQVNLPASYLLNKTGENSWQNPIGRNTFWQYF